MQWVSSHSGKLLTSETKDESSAGGSFWTGLDRWDELAPVKGFARGAVHELLYEPSDPAPLFVSLVLAGCAVSKKTNRRGCTRMNTDAFPRLAHEFSGIDPQPVILSEAKDLDSDARRFASLSMTTSAETPVGWASCPPSEKRWARRPPYGELSYPHSFVAPLVFCDPQRLIYPPAIAAMGIPLGKVYLVHPQNPADELWAMTESLRCKGVWATIAAPGRLDRTQARRLQLSAEQGGGIGIFLRPLDRNAEIYSAVTRWRVRPARGERTVQRWKIELIHGHGGQVGESFMLERNRETHLVRAAAEFSDRPVETGIGVVAG